MSNVTFSTLYSQSTNLPTDVKARLFSSAVAHRMLVPDLEVSQKEILRDYCALIDKELISYGDFPSLKGDKIERIKLYEGSRVPRYYPDYTFMDDGMKLNVFGYDGGGPFPLCNICPSSSKGGARSNIKNACKDLEAAIGKQDNPPKENPSSELLARALEKLNVAYARVQSELGCFQKQMQQLSNLKIATNDDWNYFKLNKAILEKTSLRLRRMLNSLNEAITPPYDKIYINTLASELPK